MKQIEVLQYIAKNNEEKFQNMIKLQHEVRKKAQDITKLLSENMDIFPEKIKMQYQEIERRLNDICIDANKIEKLYNEFKKGYMDVITSNLAYHEVYYG